MRTVPAAQLHNTAPPVQGSVLQMCFCMANGLLGINHYLAIHVRSACRKVVETLKQISKGSLLLSCDKSNS